MSENKYGERFAPTSQMQAIYDAALPIEDGIIVKAGAGAGKTSTIEGLYKRLNLGEKLLVTSFTRRITGELSARMPAATAIGFHKMGYDALKRTNRFLRWSKDSVNKYKYQDIFKELKLGRLFPDRKEEEAAWLMEQLVHFVMVDLCEPTEEQIDELADRFTLTLPGEFGNVLEALQIMMARGREQTFNMARINFDEMLYYTVLEQWQLPRFTVVAVDEWQDTNALQMGLVELISKDMLVAVGDERQSIFLFAGARTDAMAQGQSVFGLNPYPLNECFRCGKAIVRHANTWMPELTSPDWMHEGSVTSMRRAEMPAALRSGDAVLCRINSSLVSECLSLISKGMKAVIRGKDIGSQLMQIIEKVAGSKYATMEGFEDKLEAYRDREAARIIRQGGKRVNRLLAVLEDKIRCVMALYDDCNPANVGQMRKKVESIFTDTPGPGVQLMSVHGSKGLEFDRVFIIEPQLLPLNMPGMSDEQMQQELNLCGVAATRAKNELIYVYNEG